jgi:hypothetical protein
MSILLREIAPGDGEVVASVAGGPAWRSDAALWAEYLLDQKNGRRIVLLAFEQGKTVGYGAGICFLIAPRLPHERCREAARKRILSNARRWPGGESAHLARKTKPSVLVVCPDGLIRLRERGIGKGPHGDTD